MYWDEIEYLPPNYSNIRATFTDYKTALQNYTYKYNLSVSEWRHLVRDG